MSKENLNNDEKKFNITIPENHDGKPIEIRFLEGEAPQTFEYETQKFKQTVAMCSIATWIERRPIVTPVTENPAVLIFSLDPKRPVLSYHANPADSLATVLHSSLTVNPELELFNINKDHLFSQKELEKLVIKLAHCFGSAKAQELRKQLLNFEIKFEQTIISQNDKQGNTKDMVESAIKMVAGSIPSEIKITLPLYKAQKKVELTLQIEIDKIAATNKPGFAFYCLELEPMMRDAAETIILTEVSKFKDTHVCLEVE